MCLTLHRDIIAAPVEDGIVLLDQRYGRYWQLNATGALVMRALLNGSSLGQAAQDLSRRHAVGVEQATADATALLQQLRTAGLVTP
jgi:hypothetical protein